MFQFQKVSAPVPAVPPPPPPVQRVDTLSNQLLALSKVGAPTLRWSSTFESWHAKIDMFTSVTGTSIEVKSEYNHKTADSAVAELHERVVTTLRFLGRDM